MSVRNCWSDPWKLKLQPGIPASLQWNQRAIQHYGAKRSGTVAGQVKGCAGQETGRESTGGCV